MTSQTLPAERAVFQRRNSVTLKLLLIAGLIVVLLVPLHLINALRQERSDNRVRGAIAHTEAGAVVSRGAPAVRAERRGGGSAAALAATSTDAVFDAYRMVERAVKHGALVLALVFAAFFLFETLAGLRLHLVHYGLVGAAMCLFYLALLALGEVLAPGVAYVGAAVASSMLITLYSGAVLRTWGRAGVIGGLLAAVHSVLYVVLRMEEYALLAGTGALFAALAAVMYFTRNVDWQSQEAPSAGGLKTAP